MSDFNQSIIDEFRANNGVVGGGFAGATIVILHTTGAKSGTERVNPLVTLTRDGRLYVFASAAGAPKHPDWYHNLVAHPAVRVEMGADAFDATAHPVSGEERDRIYAEQVAVMPTFGEYQAKTTRQIPVVELVRG
ncbi:MAG: nitroreductase family deazaflavin-dependent oxidoreductase [Acidimicrobiales bacterium]